MRRIGAILADGAELWKLGVALCFVTVAVGFFGAILGGVVAAVAQLLFGLSNGETIGLWKATAFIWLPISLGLVVGRGPSWRMPDANGDAVTPAE